jgi:ribokinase
MEKVDYFLINEVEGKQITGELRSDHILKEMQKRYPKAGVVLTLGEKGAIYQDQTQTVIQNAVKTNVVDTTAAGDTFTGYFLAAVMEKRMKQEALKEAAYAAALAVSRKGASVSIPEKEEVIRLISEKEGKGSIRL